MSTPLVKDPCSEALGEFSCFGKQVELFSTVVVMPAVPTLSERPMYQDITMPAHTSLSSFPVLRERQGPFQDIQKPRPN
jgi:hypothetical protein